MSLRIRPADKIRICFVQFSFVLFKIAANSATTYASNQLLGFQGVVHWRRVLHLPWLSFVAVFPPILKLQKWKKKSEIYQCYTVDNSTILYISNISFLVLCNVFIEVKTDGIEPKAIICHTNISRTQLPAIWKTSINRCDTTSNLANCISALCP